MAEQELAQHKRIAQYVRQQISSGRWRPCQRMPSHAELCAKFDATAPIVHKAMKQLAEEKFIVSQSTKGTFVAEYPPHLFNYGFLFPDFMLKEGDQYSLFWAALQQAAVEFSSRGPKQIEFYNSSEVKEPGELPPKLAADLECGRLAGLVNTRQTEGVPLLNERAAPPIVALGGEDLKGAPRVYPDLWSFMERAIDYLAGKNRRRVAFLTRYHPDSYFEKLEQLIRTREIETRPYWLQCLDWAFPKSVLQVVHLLMSNSSDRPNALIINEDNIVAPALAGLRLAGVEFPHEVMIVAHCNYPVINSPTPGVTRLGFSAPEIIECCLEVIDRQRADKKVPSFTPIPARFEAEYLASLK